MLADVVRQFETIGTWALNGSAGITASRDKLHAHQVLARQKIGMPVTAFASSPKDTANLIGLVGSAPLIVKLLESTQGKGVVLAEIQEDLARGRSLKGEVHAAVSAPLRIAKIPQLREEFERLYERLKNA